MQYQSTITPSSSVIFVKRPTLFVRRSLLKVFRSCIIPRSQNPKQWGEENPTEVMPGILESTETAKARISGKEKDDDSTSTGNLIETGDSAFVHTSEKQSKGTSEVEAKEQSVSGTSTATAEKMGGENAMQHLRREDSIPVGQRADGLEYLKLSDIRSQLKPQDSPFIVDNNAGGGFVGDTDLVQISIMKYDSPESSGSQCQGLFDPSNNVCIDLPMYALRSGPRRTIYQNPKEVTAAIVTVGGLCPGLNDVIQNIVYTLADYGVPEDQIFGIRYGLRGFLDRHAKPVQLNRATVDGIQLKGGTFLGTSRGNAKIKDIVDRLRLWGITMLFVIGGNGGNAAAHAIAKECLARNVICNVVGVPKSIDNDIQLIDRCFGFDTAVEEAQRSLICARVEARSAAGITIVKLMGRQSGFIAMNASMASGVVDVCLIPEVHFKLPNLLDFVRNILENKDYCVVCVAEGAGQDILDGSGSGGTDASGNPILKDIGVFLLDVFKQEFKGVDVKYIDPSYMIRSIPTITTDRIYCKVLGQGAVHGAFAGFTDFTVGLINTHFAFLPTTTIIASARTVDPTGRQWNRLKTAIGQPDLH